MGDIRGRFIWYETLTTDVQGAIDFYTKLTGWGIQEWTGMGEPYHMWTNGGRPIGGVMKLPPGQEAPACWMGYVGTPNVDETAARVKTLGGQVLHGPQDIPTVGRFAVLQDPQGAVFAAYTPSQPHETPAEPPGVGSISWNELGTSDVDGALRFYGDLFGWVPLNRHDMGEHGVYLEYGLKGAPHPLGGMFKKTADMPGPPCFSYYIRIADLAVTLDGVRKSGGSVLTGPQEVPGGDLIAVCTDPQGAVFALHQAAAKPA